MSNAAALHKDAIVVDCHNDLLLLVARKRALGDTRFFAEYCIPALRAGGVDVQVLPVFVESEHSPEGVLRRALLMIEGLYREIEANTDEVALCRTAADIESVTRAGKIALVPALEGCDAIAADVELLRTFYRLGVRIASLTHLGRTLLADGSSEEGTGGRLTVAGVAAVTEMERLGIVVDVSHLSSTGLAHVLELATRPVIASHSSARALCDHHRNLTDEQLRGVAGTGGVIGVNFLPGFIDPGNPTVDRVADHIEHIAEVAGIDHVGMGADYVKEYFDELYPQHDVLRIEGLDVKATIDGFASPRDLPNLTEALVRRGVGDEDIRKVLGGNFLRVFAEVMGLPKHQTVEHAHDRR